MLHWLAGAKVPEGTDHDTSALIDAPETPAPVFAVRAFKHAIFGTPQQTPLNSRRHSTNERERHRPTTAGRATRPPITRPKSAGDAAGLAKQENLPEPIPSPTKGILMTPGTAAARRKTVTFGEHVLDNAKDKIDNGSKTGLPVNFPGKFPSPWVKSADKPENAGTPNERKRNRSKLTEELHKAKEESAKKKAVENRNVGEQTSGEHVEPDSESGRYWKMELDMYRENTTREVKKLIAKQRAAKSFARDKDLQCTELADQLRQEKKKVEKLEVRAAELEAQLKALQAQVGNFRPSSPTETTRATQRRSVLVGEGATTAARPTHTRSRSTDQPSTIAREDDFAPKPPQLETSRARTRQPSMDPQDEAKGGVRPRVRHQPGNLPSDLWSHSLAAEEPATPSKADTQAGSTKHGRAVTSGTNLTPLKSLSINAQHKIRTSRRDTVQRSPERQPASTPAFLRDDPTLAPPAAEAKEPKRYDSLEFESGTQAESASGKVATNASPPLPSSPFDPEGSAHGLAAAASEKPLPPRPARSGRADFKENVSPSRVSPDDSKDAATNSHITRAGVAGGPLKAKDGTDVSEDRLAAAKARLAARGRKIS